MPSQSYMVTLTDAGQWMHAPGSDFVFAYIDDSWTDSLKEEVGRAFVAALRMSSKIKDAVLKTSGQSVVNGLYLVNYNYAQPMTVTAGISFGAALGYQNEFAGLARPSTS